MIAALRRAFFAHIGDGGVRARLLILLLQIGLATRPVGQVRRRRPHVAGALRLLQKILFDGRGIFSCTARLLRGGEQSFVFGREAKEN